MVKTILTCSKLCLALYYNNGFPIQGMPDKCFCADEVSKDALPPLPITLKIYGPPSPSEDPPEDNRAKIEYDSE